MSKPWFAPKAYGYGATPCSWEGWVATVLFVVALRFAMIELHPYGRAAVWDAFIALLAAFLVLIRLKSSAPWRWRWRKDDAG